MDTLKTAKDRLAAYWLLSQCYHPPDESLLDALRETDVDGLCPASFPTLDVLKKDYAQLFIGPFDVSAPPYGSVYLENNRQVCGDTTMDMTARYRAEGLKVALKEPADHVAVELEYMYLLVFREMEAITAGDDGKATVYLDKQRYCLQTHLGVWMPALTERIVENARTEFYRHLAMAAESFVSQNLDVCSNRINSSVCSG